MTLKEVVKWDSSWWCLASNSIKCET